MIRRADFDRHQAIFFFLIKNNNSLLLHALKQKKSYFKRSYFKTFKSYFKRNRSSLPMTGEDEDMRLNTDSANHGLLPSPSYDTKYSCQVNALPSQRKCIRRCHQKLLATLQTEKQGISLTRYNVQIIFSPPALWQLLP